MRMVLVAGVLMLALFVALISSVSADGNGRMPAVAHAAKAAAA